MLSLRILGSLSALAVAAACPAAASATCLTSTPAPFAIADAPADAQTMEIPGATPAETFAIGAPEIAQVTGTIDGACTISFDTQLTLPAGETEPLVERESLRYYLDTDANPATGGTSSGAEWLVLIDGANGSDTVQLTRWNGSAFAEPRQLGLTGTVGFTLPLAAVGITAPGTIGMRVHSRLIGPSGESLVDIAPDRALVQALFPLNFAVPAPPALPAPAPVPVRPASPAVTVPACKVPTVTGLTTARALKKLKSAGCKVKVVRRASRKARPGRVLATTSAAGRTTAKTVTVVVSKRPVKKRRR